MPRFLTRLLIFMAMLLPVLLWSCTGTCQPGELEDGGEDFQKACLSLARTTLVSFLDGQNSQFRFPTRFSSMKYGVFVTLEKGDKVRGCRGTLYPSYAGMEDEIRENTIGAASRDERFTPVSREELPFIRISITIVENLEPLQSIAGLQKSEGLVAMTGDRVGIVLPFEGSAPSVRGAWALKKAGITSPEGVSWYRLKGIRFAEKEGKQ